MIESLLYQQLDHLEVKCQVCNHYCQIRPSKRGVCGLRENQQGKLVFLAYEKAISLAVDPIEKKPFFHFQPGSQSLSFATIGCNLRCDNCQNYQISQASKSYNAEILGDQISPQKIVDLALQNRCQSIAYTYTEPTVYLEYALETMKIAHDKGLKNIWVTNGYMSRETRELILPYLDAANVDLKYFSEDLYQKHCGAKLAPILDNLIFFKKNKVWLEITTLIIPTITDTKQNFEGISNFIYNKLTPDTPWHISKFSPEISYKLQNLFTTPTETLKQAYEVGKKIGLKYVYVGNLPANKWENTYCPE